MRKLDTDIPDGLSRSSDDCNDSDSDIFPGATEYCDGVDNDCAGESDEGFIGTEVYWFRGRRFRPHRHGGSRSH